MNFLSTFFSFLFIIITACTASCTSEQRSSASESDSAAMELHQGDQGVSELQSQGDSTFVLNLGRIGLAEFKAAELALERANDQKLAQYAAEMANSQKVRNAKLRSLSLSKGISFPNDLDIEHQKILETLRSKRSKEFRIAYLDISKNHLQQAVSYLQEASQSLEDNDLRIYATRTLQELKVLLQQVSDLFEEAKAQ